MKFVFLFCSILFSTSIYAEDCAKLFQNDSTLKYRNIDEFLIQSNAKEKIIEISKRSAKVANFVLRLIHFQDFQYYKKTNEILEGKYSHVNYKKLGFENEGQATRLKDQVMIKQFLVLSIMDPKDLTKEFQENFLNIVEKIYSPLTRKHEVEMILNKLERIIQEYS